jgi:hypothetical protein
LGVLSPIARFGQDGHKGPSSFYKPEGRLFQSTPSLNCHTFNNADSS